MDPSLELSDIKKTYGDVEAVKGVSLAITPGVIYGLLGPNGAGKTTTIRMIMDIVAPDSGEVRFFGRPRRPEDLRRIGYLPEERGLYRKMTVIEQLVFLGELHGLKRARRRAPRDRLGSSGSSSAPGARRRSRSCRRACSRRSSSSARCSTSPRS